VKDEVLKNTNPDNSYEESDFEEGGNYENSFIEEPSMQY